MSNKDFEWSMGNGQCPACHGLGPVFDNPHDPRSNQIGHASDCELAELMTKAGSNPLMMLSHITEASL